MLTDDDRREMFLDFIERLVATAPAVDRAQAARWLGVHEENLGGQVRAMLQREDDR